MTSTATLSSRRSRRMRGDSQDAKPFTSRMALLLAALLGLPLLYGGAGLLLAGIASYQAQSFLDDWARKGERPGAHAWQIAQDAAQRAIDLHPGANGAYLERLGRIQLWKQFGLPLGAPEAERTRRAALQAFRAAGEARPTWPFNWTALAYAKLYLLEFDDEFAQALERAGAFGPTRIEVNRSLAEIGLIAWPQLSDEQRRATLAAAEKTVKYSTKEAQGLLAIAGSSGMHDPLCASLADSLKQQRKICL